MVGCTLRQRSFLKPVLEMLDRFVFQSTPVRTVFGPGTIATLGDELKARALARVLIVCSKGRSDLARRIAAGVAKRSIGICDAAQPNMPRAAFEQVTESLRRHEADGFVAVGGGSSIGLGKAAAATSGLPFIAVVTSYSGSEMSSHWRVEGGQDPLSGNSAAALPACAIYDPELMLDLPARTSAASGMNAMAHAVESLYGHDTNPVVATLAEEAIRRLAASLPRIVADPRGIAARTDALYGAWLAAAFRATACVEHTIAQTLRRLFGLDHAHTHAVVLPYAVGFNRQAAPAAMSRIEYALGVQDAALGLHELNVRLGLPTGLKDIGMAWDNIPAAVAAIAPIKVFNPRPVGREDVRNILTQAFAGDPPQF
jgi:maleylacetate reductase